MDGKIYRINEEVEVEVEEGNKKTSTFCEGIQRESTNGVKFQHSRLLVYNRYTKSL